MWRQLQLVRTMYKKTGQDILQHPVCVACVWHKPTHTLVSAVLTALTRRDYVAPLDKFLNPMP